MVETKNATETRQEAEFIAAYREIAGDPEKRKIAYRWLQAMAALPAEKQKQAKAIMDDAAADDRMNSNDDILAIIQAIEALQ